MLEWCMLTYIFSNLDRNPVVQYNYDAFFGIEDPIMYVKLKLTSKNSAHVCFNQTTINNLNYTNSL